jgi:WD40 repeat protein
MGHRRRSWCVAVSPVANVIASTGDEGCLKVWKWDTPTAAETVIQSTERMYGIELSGDGKTLATLSETGETSLWDAGSGRILSKTSGAMTNPDFSGWQINHLAFSNKDARLAYTAELCEVVLRDARGQREEMRVVEESSPFGVFWALSPDGRFLATAAGSAQISIWNTQTKRRVMTVPKGGAIHLAFSPDASTLLVGYGLGPILLFDVASGAQLPFQGAHAYRITAATFSTDGKSICTASEDGICNVWNLDGTMRASLVGHRAAINDVALSPDGKTVATAGEDGTIRLWNPATGDELLVFDVLHPAMWVKFSPDGESLYASRNVHGRHTQVYKWSIK